MPMAKKPNTYNHREHIMTWLLNYSTRTFSRRFSVGVVSLYSTGRPLTSAGPAAHMSSYCKPIDPSDDQSNHSYHSTPDITPRPTSDIHSAPLTFDPKNIAPSMYLGRYTTTTPQWTGSIVPYGQIGVSPLTGALHYGQAIFEGLKAIKGVDEKVRLFRPDKNAERMQRGAERYCMPPISTDEFVQICYRLVASNYLRVPNHGSGSLYIRPNIFASTPVMGVAPADDYTTTFTALSVGSYFPGGLTPVSILVTDVPRATDATGNVKAAGNYVVGMQAVTQAKTQGFNELLYTRQEPRIIDNKIVYLDMVEEVGAMNIVAYFSDSNTLVTPNRPSILPSITRATILEIAKKQGIHVQERDISVQELLSANEVFGVGTAAIVAPVGSITYRNVPTIFNNGAVGTVTSNLYKEYSAIQSGEQEDTDGWTIIVDPTS